jgi:hypothetical protein
MKKAGMVVLVVIAAIGLIINAQRKSAERAAKKQVQTEVTATAETGESASAEVTTDKSNTISEKNNQKEAYEAANRAFIQAYFTYGSYEERQKHSEPLLTEVAKKEVQLSVFNPTERVQSIVIDSSCFYKEEDEKFVTSLNEIQLDTKMNDLPSKLSVVYHLSLVYKNKTWKVDSIKFVGSRSL